MGKYGIDRIDMGLNGVFVVRFCNLEGKKLAMEVGPILYDKKPVIMKEWSILTGLNEGDNRSGSNVGSFP